MEWALVGCIQILRLKEAAAKAIPKSQASDPTTCRIGLEAQSFLGFPQASRFLWELPLVKFPKRLVRKGLFQDISPSRVAVSSFRLHPAQR